MARHVRGFSARLPGRGAHVARPVPGSDSTLSPTPATEPRRAACSMSHPARICATAPIERPGAPLSSTHEPLFRILLFTDRDEGPTFLSRVVLSVVLLTAGIGLALFMAGA